MNELEISGKRYISTRLAAKKHKYHPDYIGQLVRAGKVEGQKVGRAWYVHARSLEAYLNNEPLQSETRENSVPIEERKAVTPGMLVIETAEPTFVVEKEIEKEVVIETNSLEPIKNEIGQIEIEKKVEVEKNIHKIAITKIMPQKKVAGLTYMPDESPLFPAIKKSSVFVQNILEKDKEADIEPILIKPHVPTRKKSRVIARSIILLIVGGVVFTGVAFLSSRVVWVSNLVEGQPASAGYTTK